MHYNVPPLSMMLIMTNLQLQLSHPSFKLQQLHIECGLLSLKRSDLLLYPGILGFLVRIVSLHFLLDLEQLVCQGLTHILRLHSQHTLERFFFATQNLHVFFVVVQFICQLSYHILQKKRYRDYSVVLHVKVREI